MAFKYLRLYDLKKQEVKKEYTQVDKLEFEYNVARTASVRIY